jgi:hypothetical protein
MNEENLPIFKPVFKAALPDIILKEQGELQSVNSVPDEDFFRASTKCGVIFGDRVCLTLLNVTMLLTDIFCLFYTEDEGKIFLRIAGKFMRPHNVPFQNTLFILL